MRTTKLQLLTVLLAGILPSAFAGPLHDAANAGDIATVKRLLDNGAYVDEKDEYGATPLMLAANGLQPEVVKLLLLKGANVYATKGNATVLDYAEYRGFNTGTALLIKTCMANPQGWLEQAKRAQATTDAREQAIRDQAAATVAHEQAEKGISQLTNAPLGQLLGKQELDNTEYVEVLTDAIITAKNKQLPDFLATATSEQKVDMLTSVEKQIARVTARIDEVNAEAGTAVSKGQDPVPFRKRAGQIKAYINVLNEIKATLEQS